jgi:hypothetical protein
MAIYRSDNNGLTWVRVSTDFVFIHPARGRGFLVYLVFERRCRFMPRDAVAAAQERTLHDDVQQGCHRKSGDGVEQRLFWTLVYRDLRELQHHNMPDRFIYKETVPAEAGIQLPQASL